MAERERRFLVDDLTDGVVSTHRIVERFEDGSLRAEIDSLPGSEVPSWLAVRRQVTADEEWTGAGRAARGTSGA